MKQLTFIYEMLKFILISLPLALMLWLTASTYFEVKRILYKNKL